MAKLKLTTAVIESICSSIRGGSYILAACGRARVSRRSFYEWKERGEKEREEGRNTIHVKFIDALEHAEADNEVMLVESVSSDVDWRAKMEILKRRYKERWGDSSKTELSGPGGQPLPTAAIPPLTIIYKNEGHEVPEFIDQTDETPKT